MATIPNAFHRAAVHRRPEGIQAYHKRASLLAMIALMSGLCTQVGCTKKLEGSTLTEQPSTTGIQPDERISTREQIEHYENTLETAYKVLSDTNAQKKNGFVYSIKKSTDGVLWYMSIERSLTSVDPVDTSNGRASDGATIFFQKPGLGEPPSITVHWKDPEREDINFFPDKENMAVKGGAQAKEIADLIQKIADVSQIPAVSQVAKAVGGLSTILPLPKILLPNKDGKIVALRANLGGADLRDADLRDANLEDADLRGANLVHANLRNAILRDANLEGADLRGADLQGTNIRFASLEGNNLRGAKLRGADLRGADLQGADLRGANLLHARLWNARLWNADLRGANLRGADLQGADLQGANLRGAYLAGADLRNASIGGAKMPFMWRCFVAHRP